MIVRTIIVIVLLSVLIASNWLVLLHCNADNSDAVLCLVEEEDGKEEEWLIKDFIVLECDPIQFSVSQETSERTRVENPLNGYEDVCLLSVEVPPDC